MIILTIRTDKPEAETGLYENENQLVYKKWQAHRELAETIHQVIAENLHTASKEFNNLEGIVVFKGPGSFTGLRIGISLANALAASLEIPIVGTSGGDWIDDGIDMVLNRENDGLVVPEYGSPPHITQQKK